MALIQFNDILTAKDLSKHLESQATPYIEEAEFIDLKPLLGELFYYDIIKNVGEPSYSVLIDGGVYVHSGFEVNCPGLKKVLIEFAYARIVFFANEKSTPFGLVEKQYQDGRNVERGRLKERYKSTQQIAFQYWLEVKAYLDRNPLVFKNYQCELSKGLARMKLRHIR